jgi:hypothetical protein
MTWIFLGWMFSRLFVLGVDPTSMSPAGLKVMDGGGGQPPKVMDGGGGQPPKVMDGGGGQPPKVMDGGGGQPPKHL